MQRLPPLLHRQAEAGGHRWPGGALRAPVRQAGQEVASGDVAGPLAAGRAAKLRALVGAQWGPVVGASSAPAASVVAAVAGGAAIADGDRAWVLIDDGLPARFGPALAWARRAGVRSLDVLVANGGVVGAAGVVGTAGVVARRAEQFAWSVAVWEVHGTSLAPASPGPLPAVAGVDGGPIPDLLRAHGCEVVSEHGEVRGEVLGLEVARVVDGGVTVGVGRHDRDARTVMRSGVDAGASLDEAVAAVRTWRRPGVARHAANTMRRSRWLRSVVCEIPSLVGVSVSLEPVAPPVPLGDLTDDSAAPCAGLDVVVVCSVGVDLDLVPTAADCRLLYGPSCRLVVVVPEGDDLAITRELAGVLAVPAEVATVPRAWEGLASAP